MSRHFGSLDRHFIRDQSGYIQDHIRATTPTHRYNGEVGGSATTTTQDSSKSCRFIDGAVRVESVEEQVRKNALNYFKSLEQQSVAQQQTKKANIRKSMIVTALGVTLGAAGLAAISLYPPLAVPLAISGIALMFFGGIQWRSAHQSRAGHSADLQTIKQEQQKWIDPINTYREQRREVGRQGFKYCLRHQLKGTIVHSEELQTLWTNDFKKLLEGPVVPATIFKADLLGDSARQYAWDGSTLPVIKTPDGTIGSTKLDHMSRLYKECRTSYYAFKDNVAYESEIVDTRQGVQQRTISNLRKQWHQPAENNYDSNLKEATRLYNLHIAPFKVQRDAEQKAVRGAFACSIRSPSTPQEVAYNRLLKSTCQRHLGEIGRNFNNHSAVIAITTNYKNDKNMCKPLYDQANLLVDAFFDKQTKQLNETVKVAKQMIAKSDQLGEEYFKTTLTRILHPEQEGSQGLPTAALPQIADTSDLFAKIQEEPKRGEIYGQHPEFDASRFPHITRSAWNHFWGDRGLGLFSGRERGAWVEARPQATHFNWMHLANERQPLQQGLVFGDSYSVPPRPVRISIPTVSRAPTLAAGREVPGTRRRSTAPVPLREAPRPAVFVASAPTVASRTPTLVAGREVAGAGRDQRPVQPIPPRRAPTVPSVLNQTAPTSTRTSITRSGRVIPGGGRDQRQVLGDQVREIPGSRARN